MNTRTSLPVAIMSFAFTGVFGPHPRRAIDYAAPRVVSAAAKIVRHAGAA